MITRSFDMAELIVSCWLLSGDDKMIPSSQGVLDFALKNAVDCNAFPEWARQELHFVDSRVGLQCIELATILDRAQGLAVTNAPNPSYQRTGINISARAAHQYLDRLSVSEDDARNWGRLLREGVRQALQQSADSEYAETVR